MSNSTIVLCSQCKKIVKIELVESIEKRIFGKPRITWQCFILDDYKEQMGIVSCEKCFQKDKNAISFDNGKTIEQNTAKEIYDFLKTHSDLEKTAGNSIIKGYFLGRFGLHYDGENKNE